MKMGPSSNARTFSTVFLEPSGQIRHIFIPIHALTDKSSIHDSNMQAQLKAKLESEDIQTEPLIDLIKSAKSAMSKLHMMKEILKYGKVDPKECRKVMDFLQDQVDTSQVAKRHCQVMSKALSLFEYLNSISEAQDLFCSRYEKAEDVQADFQCTAYDSVNFYELYKNANPEENERIFMDMATFMACFQFLHDHDDCEDYLPLKHKHADSMMVSFLQQLGLALILDYEKTLQNCQYSLIKPQDLLQALLKNSSENLTLKPKSMFKLFQLCFDLQQDNEEMANFQILLQSAKSFLIKSNMNFKLYFTILTWKSFLANTESMNSYAEDWSQILHFTQSFIDIKTAAFKSTLQFDENFYCYKDTFQCGSGKIVEIIATWMVDSNIKSVQNENIQGFLKVANLHFPCSMQSDILIAHLTWEYCHRWNKSKANLQLLQDTLDCLETIARPEIQQRLSRLLWNVLLNKPTKDAINLTEIRSATRCERELVIFLSILSTTRWDKNPQFIQKFTF